MYEVCTHGMYMYVTYVGAIVGDSGVGRRGARFLMGNQGLGCGEDDLGTLIFRFG